MKAFISAILPLATAIVIFAAPLAYAESCASKAQKIADKRNAELLGVSNLGGGKCRAKLFLPPKNGKPGRVVTRKFNR